MMSKIKTGAGSGRTVAKLREKQALKKEQTAGRQPMIQAMVWYEEEQYLKLRGLFADADLLPPAYRDWLSRAEEKRAEVEAEGDQVIKVYIDPETFPQWCEERKLRMDADARSQLAIEVAQAHAFSL